MLRTRIGLVLLVAILVVALTDDNEVNATPVACGDDNGMEFFMPFLPHGHNKHHKQKPDDKKKDDDDEKKDDDDKEKDDDDKDSLKNKKKKLIKDVKKMIEEFRKYCCIKGCHRQSSLHDNEAAAGVEEKKI